MSSAGDSNIHDVASGEGTISALGDKVEINCQGAASALIEVKGTFDGTLTLTGSGQTLRHDNRVEGNRELYLPGIASLGANTIVNTGEAMTRQFRCLAGGRSLKIEATAWNSGSCEVRIVATDAPSLIGIAGPIHNSLEEAIRSGRAFSVNTGTQDISTGDKLNFIFSNPSDSNKNYFVDTRRFVNDRSGNDNLIQAALVVSPSELTSPTTLSAIPLKTGVGSSDAEIGFNTSDTDNMGASDNETPLPLNGIALEINTPRLVQPGESFGYRVEAIGGASLGSGAKTALTVIWYEEPIV